MYVQLFCSAPASMQTKRQALLLGKGPSAKQPLSNFTCQLLMSTCSPQIPGLQSPCDIGVGEALGNL